MRPLRSCPMRPCRRAAGHSRPVFGRPNGRGSLPGLLVLGRLQRLAPALVLHAGADGVLLLLFVGRGDPDRGGRGGPRKRGFPLGGQFDPVEKPLDELHQELPGGVVGDHGDAEIHFEASAACREPA